MDYNKYQDICIDNMDAACRPDIIKVSSEGLVHVRSNNKILRGGARGCELKSYFYFYFKG